MLAAEALRRQIPAPVLVELVLQGAITGRIPLIDRVTMLPTGQFTDLTDVKRLELLTYLVDKAIPNKPATDTLLELDEPDIEAIDLDDAAVRELSNEQLSQILGSTAQRQGVTHIVSAVP